MEVYITKDNTVAKYIHDNGSETAIKTLNPGDVGCGGSGRNKFNVFASCSVGCKINCAFCFLTTKKYKYHHVEYSEIVVDICDAVDSELSRRPELKDVPMNISWMGMGDPWMDLDIIDFATTDIIGNYNGIVSSFEGVDIATTLPNISCFDKRALKSIEHELSKVNLTSKPNGRSDIRIFYSLHSMDNITRKRLIPKTLDLDVSLSYLDSLSKDFNVIYHYMFLDEINDSLQDIQELIKYFGDGSKQLRILRYNNCSGSKFKESINFDIIIKMLSREIPNLKVQISPGSEIKAACGMFIMNNKMTK